jgi:hypothetical protein
LAAAEELRTAARRTREQTQPQRARRVSAENLGEGRLDLVIAHDEKVARVGVDRKPGVAEMRMNHAGLVLLVVVDPQFDCQRLHGRHATGQTSPGFIARIRYRRPKTGAEQCKRLLGSIRHHDREMALVREGRHDLEAGLTETTNQGKAKHAATNERCRARQVAESAPSGVGEHREPEEPMSVPAVAQRPFEERIVKASLSTSDDDDHVIGWTLRTHETRPRHQHRDDSFTVTATRVKGQCLNWRSPVKTMATPSSLARAMLASSLIEPPGWTITATPAAAAASMPSGNG